LSSNRPALMALVPDHIGLTIKAQPVLFWYLSELSEKPVKIKITQKGRTSSFLEARIAPPVQSGIHALYLEDYGEVLEKDKEYKWTVSADIKCQGVLKQLTARGTIKRVDLPSSLGEKLKQAKRSQRAGIYARQSLWYDALAEVSARIEPESRDTGQFKTRDLLLEQVSLPPVNTNK